MPRSRSFPPTGWGRSASPGRSAFRRWPGWLQATVILLLIAVAAALFVLAVTGTGDDPQQGVVHPAGGRAPDAVERNVVDVVEVIDGDTIDVAGSKGVRERVRLIGIDTPERGECGYRRAGEAMAELVMGETVELVAGARDDRDAYERLLRYVDVDGDDAGLELIEAGLAIARYDSRDGYGRHDREDAYVAADAAQEHVCLTGR